MCLCQLNRLDAYDSSSDQVAGDLFQVAADLTVILLIGLWEKQKRVKKELQEIPWGSRLWANNSCYLHEVKL